MHGYDEIGCANVCEKPSKQKHPFNVGDTILFPCQLSRVCVCEGGAAMLFSRLGLCRAVMNECGTANNSPNLPKAHFLVA